jgi:hypothetical protein
LLPERTLQVSRNIVSTYFTHNGFVVNKKENLFNHY